jgi:hypothetical protein
MGWLCLALLGGLVRIEARVWSDDLLAPLLNLLMLGCVATIPTQQS